LSCGLVIDDECYYYSGFDGETAGCVEQCPDNLFYNNGIFYGHGFFYPFFLFFICLNMHYL
jgi:hypothetical protein